MRLPNSWIVYDDSILLIMDNPNLKWMIGGGVARFFFGHLRMISTDSVAGSPKSTKKLRPKGLVVFFFPRLEAILGGPYATFLEKPNYFIPVIVG